MAVRITSASQAYTRAISLGSQTTMTVTCWVKLSVDTNAQTTLWVIDNGTGDYYGIRSDANGTTMRPQSGGTHGSREFTVGTWYYVALAIGPDGGQFVTCAAGDTAFTATTYGAIATTFAANLRIGKWPTNGDVLNGCVAGFKFWTATLSQAELEAEAFQYLPARTTNLQAWYPFLAASTTDFSGNAATLSGGTGATTEDGPPIRWGGGRRRIFLPTTTPATGTIAASLPALTGNTTGNLTVSGPLAGQLPTLSGRLDAAATISGPLAAGLPALTAALTGEISAPGLLHATLPALTGQLTGNLTGGFLTAQLPALTGTLQGDLAVQGTTPAVLPALTGSLTGEAEIPHNNLDISAGPPARGWTSRTPNTTWTLDAPARGWRARQPTT